MSRANKVSWAVVWGGMLAGLMLMIATGNGNHWPWMAMMIVVNGSILGLNARNGFRLFDAGEEVVFSVSLGVFVTMLIWAWVIGL